jgi:hypothetical protein
MLFLQKSYLAATPPGMTMHDKKAAYMWVALQMQA